MKKIYKKHFWLLRQLNCYCLQTVSITLFDFFYAPFYKIYSIKTKKMKHTSLPGLQFLYPKSILVLRKSYISKIFPKNISWTSLESKFIHIWKTLRTLTTLFLILKIYKSTLKKYFLYVSCIIYYDLFLKQSLT